MAVSIKLIPIQDEKEIQIKGTPDVPKELSKQLTNSKGKTIYFIDINYGLSKHYGSKMIFTNKYPTNEKMCEISIKINRT